MKIKQLTITLFSLSLLALATSAQVSQDTIDAHKAAVEQFRAAKDALFSDPATTPITASQQQQFDGLIYFPVDYAYRLNATYIPESNPRRERLNENQLFQFAAEILGNQKPQLQPKDEVPPHRQKRTGHGRQRSSPQCPRKPAYPYCGAACSSGNNSGDRRGLI